MTEMEKQFVPYHLARKLKMKNFNDECLGFYSSNGDLMPKQSKGLKSGITLIDCHESNTLAPLYQQAIDWIGVHLKIHIMYCEDKNAMNHQIKTALTK